MSALDDFIAKLGSDADFASVIKACKSHEAVMSAAKGAGISLTEADVTRALASQMSDLSDEELESVTSGTVIPTLMQVTIAIK